MSAIRESQKIWPQIHQQFPELLPENEPTKEIFSFNQILWVFFCKFTLHSGHVVVSLRLEPRPPLDQISLAVDSALSDCGG
jgi:hypothetical protein